MSDTINFHKIYTRQSRSIWSDLSCVTMLWDPETKGGIYLHLGDLGINGFSLSKKFQDRLPGELENTQYVSFNFIDIVMHEFGDEIEQYCFDNVKDSQFKEIFFVNQSVFFSGIAKQTWLNAYNRFIENK